MKFDPADRVQLAKIGVTSLLDLALVLPKSFEDTSLTATPREGQICVSVVLKSVMRGRSGILSALAFCEEWETSLKIVIFNAKAWHFGAFKQGREMIITGVCSRAFGGWQVTNPKIITKTGEIVPRFRTTLRDDAVKKLIAKYVSFESLQKEGLSAMEAEFIMSLQRADAKSIAALMQLRSEIAGKFDAASAHAQSENFGLNDANFSSAKFTDEIYRSNELKRGQNLEFNVLAQSAISENLPENAKFLPSAASHGRNIKSDQTITDETAKPNKPQNADNIAKFKSQATQADVIKDDEPRSLLEILKFIEIFSYIKKLSSKKTSFQSPEISPFDLTRWLANLPFRPTHDQLAAIEDIRADLVSSNAARRVVMGDVGSGKTLVILAGALMVYPHTAILMAPTSILAEQIYAEAVRLLPDFMRVRLVRSGEKPDFTDVNLIIGTHVLLYLNLPASPLVMVDEQHRFGSNQRALIEQLTSSGQTRPNFVQFSATPIPRTMSLIQSALVNFSFLREMPFVKRIHSRVLQSADFTELLAHLREQISLGKQAIIVYPLVESSENFNYQSLNEAQEFWLKNFKNVFITHGKDRDKERILREFRDHGDLLLSTTVVEVGISLPRLTTIVIVGAERLGLASLHQLRGRVGRQGGEGWCFLFTKLKSPPVRLREFCATTDGFKIAELDLKNRQSGDILDGTMQHGAAFEYYNYEEEITELAHRRALALS